MTNFGLAFFQTYGIIIIVGTFIGTRLLRMHLKVWHPEFLERIRKRIGGRK